MAALQNEAFRRISLFSPQQVKRTFQEKLKYFWKLIGKHVALIALLIGYVFAGAPIFLHLERPEELKRLEIARNLSEERKANFTTELLEISTACGNNSVECQFLFAQAIHFYEINLGINFNDSLYRWDIWNSLFYSGTIVIYVKIYLNLVKNLVSEFPKI